MQVVLASILMVATFPSRTQGLGLITEPLLLDLRLDRVRYANMNLWATLLGALACFPAGWAIDRYGLRWITAAVVLLLGIVVWQFGAVMTPGVLLFALLLATRAIGQSALSVCSIATVARWFPGRAGFAMGVYSVLLSVFFAVAFGAIGYSVRASGWRETWAWIAGILIFTVAPLVLVALREPRRNSSSARVPAETETNRHGQFTLAASLRTPAFWVFAGAGAAFNLVSSGLGLFNESILNERGFDQKTFHVFLVVTTLASLVGQFVSGWLTRRWRYQTLTFLALLVYALGLGLVPFINQHWQLWILAVLLGAAGGMIIVVFFSVWSDLFGQRHLGRIQGAAQMLTVVFSGLGPLLFAQCVKATGSYAPLLLALAGFSALLALVARQVPVPKVAPAPSRE
jgi:MFS family permease